MRIPTALRELTSAPLSGPSLGLCLAGLIVAQTAMGLPDHLSVVTTNLNTHALVTLELDRYSLRGPNWEARIYSSPTTYTVVPSDQVPEVTTYRGITPFSPHSGPVTGSCNGLHHKSNIFLLSFMPGVPDLQVWTLIETDASNRPVR